MCYKCGQMKQPPMKESSKLSLFPRFVIKYNDKNILLIQVGDLYSVVSLIGCIIDHAYSFLSVDSDTHTHIVDLRTLHTSQDFTHIPGLYTHPGTLHTHSC